jgi:beta-glucosidase-like glycosyl hydrolase
MRAMRFHPITALIFLAPTRVAAAGLTGAACNSSATYQSFIAFPDGTLRSGSLCATAASWPLMDGTAVSMETCVSPPPPAQLFNFTGATGANAISLVATAAPTFCANLAGYGTVPGTQVWLFTCTPADCESNCAWVASSGAGHFLNPNSGLCLDSGTEPHPTVPHTCADGSPSAGLPFCDYTQPIAARVADLYSRLSFDQRIELFSIPIHANTYDPILNLKSVFWDITCIAGLSPGHLDPQLNGTVFPNTIGQAASFDIDLVSRIGMATALEGRITNQINYRTSGGQTWQATLCDGGPLANTAHDPRWGRTSETYGEDVYLTQAMGIAATRALQQRTQPDPVTGLSFLKTSQVTRHYMGTHGANDMPNDAEEYILPQWREEHQMRIYEAFQRPDLGDAEGIMCAISAFAEAGDVPPPRNDPNGTRPYIPNCVNPYLMTEKLRTQWKSDCFVQSDCCDSIDAVVGHKWVATLEEAVAAVMNAGLSASYGNYNGISAALRSALADGLISNATFDVRIQRTLLTIFRVGMFDTQNPANPFAGPYDETLIDGPAHRLLAREAAAKSTVLLENRGAPAALPLASLPPKVAIIGPFADCSDRTGDYGCHEHEYPQLMCSYGHSYSGKTSVVNTVVTAARAEAAAAGGATTVEYIVGSGINAPAGESDGLAAAANLTAWADLTILVVGLGCIEAEGRDRYNLTLSSAQAALVDAVATAKLPTGRLVIAIASAGGVDLVEPRADALLQIFYNGEETGSGLWDILLGRISPSARMPETVYAWQYLGLVAPEINFNMVTLGTGRTYRFFNNSAAVAKSGGMQDSYIRYRFGYGLSYCTFEYSGLLLSLNSSDGSVNVEIDVVAVTPTARACTEVSQVYLTLPPQVGLVTPIYSLVAFAATPLPAAPAEPTHLTFVVGKDDLLTTMVNGSRVLTGGAYTFAVGGHLPDDEKGAAQSNAVVGVVQI